MQKINASSLKRLGIIISLLLTISFVAGCELLIPIAADLMQKISQKTHENRPDRKFTVSVRACDEKTHQAYREVIKEMGYELDPLWNSSTGWRFDAVRDYWEDLEISCFEIVEGEKKGSSAIKIYSRFIYFPEEPKHYKENIHQKVLERLKIQAK